MGFGKRWDLIIAAFYGPLEFTFLLLQPLHPADYPSFFSSDCIATLFVFLLFNSRVAILKIPIVHRARGIVENCTSAT